MESTARAFKDNARAAIADPQLRRALDHVKVGFIGKRAKAAACASTAVTLVSSMNLYTFLVARVNSLTTSLSAAGITWSSISTTSTCEPRA